MLHERGGQIFALALNSCLNIFTLDLRGKWLWNCRTSPVPCSVSYAQFSHIQPYLKGWFQKEALNHVRKNVGIVVVVVVVVVVIIGNRYGEKTFL